MPMSGLGLCCRLSALGGDVTRSVLWYLLLGGRHLDTAEVYNNHRAVGEGVRLAMARGVPREAIFVTTKLPPSLFGGESVAAWTSSMLSELGLDYVDLVLLHSPGDPPGAGAPFGIMRMPEACGGGDRRRCRAETWAALSSARDRGLVRNVGISNFGPRQAGDLLALGAAPIAVNQLEYHPWVPQKHRDTVTWCHRHGIAVVAYCSMGGPESVEAATAHEAVRKLAARHERTSGQILLRWALQHNVSIIPGTGKHKHMKENLAVHDFALDIAEMAEIDAQPALVAHRSYVVQEPDSAE